MNSMKRQKGMKLKDEPPECKVSNMLLEKSRGQLLIAPERMKRQGQVETTLSCVSGGEGKV